MAIPSLSDLNFYIGTLLNNNDWNKNWTKLISYLTDGTGEFTYKSFTVNSASSMGGAKLTNLGTPTTSTDGATKGYVDTVSLPRNYIAGYTLSNNVSVPNTDIDIAIGICQNSTNVQGITLGSAFTKRLSAAWVAGTGAGMLDTGSIASNTWYHIFAIAKDDGTSDILASTSATTPTLPTGYTKFRRLGSISTDVSSNIKAFRQNGDVFIRTAIEDYRVASLAAGALASLTLSTPAGVKTQPLLNIFAKCATTGELITIIADYDSSLENYVGGFGGAANGARTSYFGISTDLSSRIKHRVNIAVLDYVIATNGWIDLRGV
jgi:hypothetical protein